MRAAVCHPLHSSISSLHVFLHDRMRQGSRTASGGRHSTNCRRGMHYTTRMFKFSLLVNPYASIPTSPALPVSKLVSKRGGEARWVQYINLSSRLFHASIFCALKTAFSIRRCPRNVFLRHSILNHKWCYSQIHMLNISNLTDVPESVVLLKKIMPSRFSQASFWNSLVALCY